MNPSEIKKTSYMGRENICTTYKDLIYRIWKKTNSPLVKVGKRLWSQCQKAEAGELQV
jgi:hypothetical protein